MADKEQRIPGSITSSSDEQMQRISEVSNVNRTISEMQRKIDQELVEAEADIKQHEGIEKVQSSLMKVLDTMGTTVGSIGNGFAKIAKETSKASSEAIKQYGQAITQDININKQNLLSLTLSRSTPIFGYFAAKFMETDVFKNATQKMKENISQALGSVAAKFREGFGNFLTKIKLKKKKKPTGGIDIDEFSEEHGIPKMAKGGIVKKEGLIHAHAGEAIVPIEKILERIDESISVGRDLAHITTKMQLETMTNMNKLVKFGADTSEKNIFRAFISAASDVHKQYEQPAEMRMLRALLAIQDALGGQVNRWSQVWQKLLIEHPTFRQIIFAAKTMGNALMLPGRLIYSFFKPRGGYASHVSRSKNPMQAAAENTGILYEGSMWRLDNIIQYTRATAEAVRDISTTFTGKKYKAIEGVTSTTGVWSIFSKFADVTTVVTKHLMKQSGSFLDALFNTKIFKTKADNFFNFISKERAIPFTEKAKELKLRREYEKRPELSLEKIEKIIKVEEVNLSKNFPKIVFNSNNLLETAEQQLKNEEIRTNLERKALDINKENLKSNKKEQKKSDKLLNFTQKLVETAEHQLKNEEIRTNLERKALDINKENLKSNKKEQKKSDKLLNFTQKLVDKASATLKIQKRMDLREMRRSMYGALGGIWNKVKGLLMPALFGLLGLFKKGPGGIAGTLSRYLFGAIFKKLVPTIFNLGKNLITKLAPIFLSRVLPLLTGVIGPAIGAAITGWNIGKKIDNVLGISEKFKERLDSADKRASELQKEISEKTGTTKERVEKVRKADKTGFDEYRKIQMQAGFGKTHAERTKQVGFLGRGNLYEIQLAQEKFMLDNINEYLKYSPAEIERIRQQFIKDKKVGGKALWESPQDYGVRREKFFLAYLKGKGSMLSEAQQEIAYQQYKEKQDQFKEKPSIIEKGMQLVIDTGQTIKESFTNAIGQTKIVETLDDLNKTLKDTKNQMTEVVAQSATYVSNTYATQMNNMTRTVNSASAGARNYLDSYTNNVFNAHVDGD